MNVERRRKIIEGVEDLGTSYPEVTEDGGCWSRPFGGDPHYYRYTDGDGNSTYDIYLQKNVNDNYQGGVHVRASTHIYELSRMVELGELSEEIFSFNFIGDAPEERAFLSNLSHYQRQIDEQMDRLAGIAVGLTHHDKESDDE